MPVLTIILILLMPLLLVASGAFSAIETALFSLKHADRLRLRKASPQTAAAAANLLRSPRGLLVSLLLGNTLVNTGYFAIASVVGASLANPAWQVGFGFGALITIVAVGEVFPKSLAALHRDAACRLLARPFLAWHVMVGPIRRVAETFVGALTRLFRPAGKDEVDQLTPDELSALLAVGGRQGVLDAGEHRLLDDVVQLGTVRVKDVMTPRVAIRWLEATVTTREVLHLAGETGLDTFPVCSGDLDEETMVGMVSMHRLLPLLNKYGHEARLPVSPLLDPVRYVPDRSKLDQLLDHFRVTRSDIALCVNESGDLTGIVGLDDVIGELVRVSMTGDQAPEEQVHMVALGVWEAPGRLSIRDWVEFFGSKNIRVDPRVSTIAGLVLAKLGRVPHEGDSVTVGNLRVTVRKMRRRLIEQVTISLEPAPGTEPQAALPQEAGAGR